MPQKPSVTPLSQPQMKTHLPSCLEFEAHVLDDDSDANSSPALVPAFLPGHHLHHHQRPEAPAGPACACWLPGPVTSLPDPMADATAALRVTCASAVIAPAPAPVAPSAAALAGTVAATTAAVMASRLCAAGLVATAPAFGATAGVLLVVAGGLDRGDIRSLISAATF